MRAAFPLVLKKYRSHALIAVFIAVLFAVCAPDVRAQRDDNRRLVWTGSFGADWSGSSWKTSGSFLSHANSAGGTWTSVPGIAEFALDFLAGDSVIFDGSGDPSARTINIDPAGVTVSDIVVSGAADHTFTGGAITADGGALMPNTYQLDFSGVTPAGRLVKTGSGTLTLSNTAANVFKGGILLAGGGLAIADARALGDNDIIITATGAASGAGYLLPAVVIDADGTLLTAPTSLATSPIVFAPDLRLDVAASAAGLDITGDVFFNTGTLTATSGTLTFNIEGDTTISGRVHAGISTYGVVGGAFVKSGTGTLTLTNNRNWTTGPNTVAEGRLVITDAGAVGTGNLIVMPSGTATIRGVRGGETFPMCFVGGGRLEVEDSDIVFNWRRDTLINNPNTVSELGALAISGNSRLVAIASGTSAGLLGGTNVNVTVDGNSTLVLGREGLPLFIGAVSTLSPVNYPIIAGNLSLAGGSTLVLQPDSYLFLSGTLALDADSAITFGGGGVARIEYANGPVSDSLATIAPAGMSVAASTTATGGGGQRIDYVVVNQGANPLKDIAMTLDALDAAMDTVAGRFNDQFLIAAAPPSRNSGRKWTNSFWMNYFYSKLDYETGSSFNPGHSGNVNGMMAGFDGVFNQRLLVGFYGGFVGNDLDTTNDTSLRSHQYSVGVYATQRFKHAYASVHISVGGADTDCWRHEQTGQTRGWWDNDYYAGGVEVGAVITPWKNGFLKPYAGVRYMRVKISDFQERGASPMLVDDFHDSLTRGVLGAQAAQRFVFPLIKRPAVAGTNAAWKHSMSSPRETLVAAYESAPELPLVMDRGNYYRDAATFGAFLRVSFQKNIQAAISYEHETGSSRTRDTVSVLLGITW